MSGSGLPAGRQMALGFSEEMKTTSISYLNHELYSFSSNIDNLATEEAMAVQTLIICHFVAYVLYCIVFLYCTS